MNQRHKTDNGTFRFWRLGRRGSGRYAVLTGGVEIGQVRSMFGKGPHGTDLWIAEDGPRHVGDFTTRLDAAQALLRRFKPRTGMSLV